MPIIFKPGSRFSVILEADKSDEKPATFWFRHLTMGEFMDFASMADSFAKGDGKTAAGAVIDALKSHLVGWDIIDQDGNAIPFDREKLKDIVVLAEARELFFGIMSNLSLTRQDQKN